MKIKQFFITVVFGGIATFFSGCASIVNSGPENFNITSDPSSAKVVVIDKTSNYVIIENKTPFSISLDKGAGYFKAKQYRVKVSKDGFKGVEFDIKPTMSGWYILGNFALGGLIGWLIVDPLTGGMWNLKAQGVESKDNVIGIKLLSDISEDEKARMIKIK